MKRIVLIGTLMLLSVFAFGEEQETPHDRTNQILLYETQKVDALGPFLLNFFLPFGIGSFVQGDYTSGLLVAGGQVAGGAILLVSMNSLANRRIGDPLPAGLYVGAAISSAATIYGWIAPFPYAQKANAKLQRDLGLTVGIDGLSLTVKL